MKLKPYEGQTKIFILNNEFKTENDIEIKNNNFYYLCAVLKISLISREDNSEKRDHVNKISC